MTKKKLPIRLTEPSENPDEKWVAEPIEKKAFDPERVRRAATQTADA